MSVSQAYTKLTEPSPAPAKSSPRDPGYAALLVHVEPGLAASSRVEAAGVIARALDARLIGLGAETIDPFPAYDPSVAVVAADWLQLIREQVDDHLKQAEQVFYRDAASAQLEWRATQDFPTQAMAALARTADLLIASPRTKAGYAQSVDPAELVMTAGRPVLIVPQDHPHFVGERIVVAWKDTREARRAVADAMPFLRRAKDVVIQAVRHRDGDADAARAVNDVVAALERHGVAARPLLTYQERDDVVGALRSTLDLTGADLLVAGAYGHTRAREWVFGGVSETLLHEPPCYVLLSH
jgi:nucleotide-binding universal stress UspA family protein